jgi:hypothetical protein
MMDESIAPPLRQRSIARAALYRVAPRAGNMRSYSLRSIMPSLFRSADSKERAVGTVDPVLAGADSLTFEGVFGRRSIASALRLGADCPCPCVGVDAEPVAAGAEGLTPDGVFGGYAAWLPVPPAAVGLLPVALRDGADSLTLFGAAVPVAANVGIASSAAATPAASPCIFTAEVTFMNSSCVHGQLFAHDALRSQTSCTCPLATVMPFTPPAVI